MERQRLRIDLTDWEGNTKYADFDHFKIESEAHKYKLASTGVYRGTAGRYDVKKLVRLF